MKTYKLTVEDRQHINSWAVCGKDRLGKITGREYLPWGLSWVGEKLDGSAWASRNPIFLSDEDNHLLNELLDYKFRYQGLEF